MSRQPFDQRINAWLRENAGEQFTRNKWKFWFFPLAGFQFLNSLLTALTFRAGGELENAMGAVMLGVGALLVWLSVAFIFYSDSTDRRLARRVSLLDSVTLIAVLTHFTFLLWTFGHLRTVQSAEAKYEARAEVYNTKAEKISQDNAAIARSAEKIATETTKAERLRNDTAYQTRKAAEAGARLPGSRSAGGVAPSLSTAPIELEKPQKPDESSARFLSRWDFWIRAANLAELLLAAATLIYIRNRSAKTNAPVGISSAASDFFPTRVYKSPLSQPALRSPKNDDTVSLKRDDTDDVQKATRVVSKEGLKRLRAALSAIAFQYGPCHFKSDPKDDYIWIRQYKSTHGEARTVASCRAKLDVLDDALKMPPADFRARVERLLRQNGFEI